jgi:predicted RNA-binding Zn-ribbon protein involved in translation (DUF1610 family)
MIGRVMLNKFRRLLQRFFRKSSTLNRQPLNAGSLIVIVLVDIFILVNVFLGLNDISNWPLSPNQTYPCANEWREYNNSKDAGKDYKTVRASIPSPSEYQARNLRPTNYQNVERGHLGKVDAACLSYGSLKDAQRTPENQKTVASIEANLTKISNLENSNAKIRAQYDSALLEKVAGQAPGQSLIDVSAAQAKQKIDGNDAAIAVFKQETTDLKKTLLAQPTVLAFLSRLQDRNAWGPVEAGQRHAEFWYPSIQLGFQALFLLPVILISLAIHRFALGKNYGLVALITWHLLIIALIPALLKVFEFLQVGVFFQWIATTVIGIFGGLLFLASYAQILLIPLAGFALIKLMQRLGKSSSKPKVQAATRIARSQCLSCGKKVRSGDIHCAHCGYQQLAPCLTCNALTHRHMPHCTHCGSETPPNF